MNCLSPLRITNPHYKDYLEEARKVCGKAPDIVAKTFRTLVLSNHPFAEPFLDIPCGKCEACLVRRTNEWSFRLFQEKKNSKNCLFVTLTYNDMFVPRDKKTNKLTLSKRDCQLFIKRLRKRFGNGIRYFLCSEYGENFARPHYHLLLFNLPIDLTRYDWKARLELEIFGIWSKGDVKVDIATDGRVIYCAKYMLSNLDNNSWLDRKKPFILTSRRPGLGYSFSDDYSERKYRYETCDTKCITDKGIAFPMSRYYKDKFFDDSCKEIIKEHLKKTFREPSYSEKMGFKMKIRNKFKKQKRL